MSAICPKYTLFLALAQDGVVALAFLVDGNDAIAHFQVGAGVHPSYLDFRRGLIGFVG